MEKEQTGGRDAPSALYNGNSGDTDRDVSAGGTVHRAASDHHQLFI